MLEPALGALLRLEARRAWVHLRKTASGLVVVAVGMFFLMGRGRDGVGMAMALVGFIFGLTPAWRSLLDKLDGSLEFLTSLPVQPSRLATAQVLACAAWATTAALPWTLGLDLFLEATVGKGLAPVQGVLSFLGICVATAGISSLLSGALVRFAMETLTWLPVAALLGLVGLGHLVEAVWPGSEQAVVAWLAAPGAPTRLALVLTALGCAALFLGGVLLRSGYRRFRPSGAPLPPSVSAFPS
jgi:hypothetical protein